MLHHVYFGGGFCAIEANDIVVTDFLNVLAHVKLGNGIVGPMPGLFFVTVWAIFCFGCVRLNETEPAGMSYKPLICFKSFSEFKVGLVDAVYINAVQTGIVTVTNCVYDEPSGICTITTSTEHGFSVDDPITMSGLEFTCPGGSGITTTIFPEPQASYVVDSIVDTVGTSKTFTTTS